MVNTLKYSCPDLAWSIIHGRWSLFDIMLVILISLEIPSQRDNIFDNAKSFFEWVIMIKIPVKQK